MTQETQTKNYEFETTDSTERINRTYIFNSDLMVSLRSSCIQKKPVDRLEITAYSPAFNYSGSIDIKFSHKNEEKFDKWRFGEETYESPNSLLSDLEKFEQAIKDCYLKNKKLNLMKVPPNRLKLDVERKI